MIHLFQQVAVVSQEVCPETRTYLSVQRSSLTGINRIGMKYLPESVLQGTIVLVGLPGAVNAFRHLDNNVTDFFGGIFG